MVKIVMCYTLDHDWALLLFTLCLWLHGTVWCYYSFDVCRLVWCMMLIGWLWHEVAYGSLAWSFGHGIHMVQLFEDEWMKMEKLGGLNRNMSRVDLGVGVSQRSMVNCLTKSQQLTKSQLLVKLGTFFMYSSFCLCNLLYLNIEMKLVLKSWLVYG